jgi:hypothetical protein
MTRTAPRSGVDDAPALLVDAPAPTGRIELIDGLEWYVIDDVDLLDPFLVTLTSPDDHWAFVSSSGAMTLGRRDAGRALFPYVTDDQLHRAGGRAGPVTMLRVDGEVWEPFAPHTAIGAVRRSLAKTLEGDRLRFEERHPGLGLTFRATLASADEHGFIRRCELVREVGHGPVSVEVLDGLVDVLPPNVLLELQQTSSTLVDAYRRSEVVPGTDAALYALEARITDGADAAESLCANLVWSRGLDDGRVALSERQLRAFRSGEPVRSEQLTTGVKGAYLRAATVTLAAGGTARWALVADVHLDHVEIARRLRWLEETTDPVAAVDDAVERSHAQLVALVASQDGLQRSGDRAADGHHLASTLFNAMRGGALLDDHRVRVDDVVASVAVRNRPAAERIRPLLEGLDDVVEIDTVREAVGADRELVRLVDEYEPFTFSRRHGDPSRPWNRFSIVVRDQDGDPVTAYEGNWRDIFQNWEATLHSFPAYLRSAVAKFLNASTRDGHNPYRIDHTGIDWELPEEGAWANFGYWGDHQLVYLQRLLVAHQRFHPGQLEGGLADVVHSYADVPYVLRPYADIVADPKRTLDFDQARQAATERRVAELGTDGRLVPGADGGVHHASLAEKLLVPALAKLSNLVPGGGVWMNMQRPEWNDANNALVGNGLSVVTAFHLHDYLGFVDGLLTRTGVTEVPMDPAVTAWVAALRSAFEDHEQLLDPSVITPITRRSLLDRLGVAYERYRVATDDVVPTPARMVAVAELAEAVRLFRAHVEVVTDGAARGDGLVDSYRVLVLGDGTAEVRPLYEMLEGQVAALTNPAQDPVSVVEAVDAMVASGLYRSDHESFLLYPNRSLPSFLERNIVPEHLVIGPLAELVDAPGRLLRRDVEGRVRFAGEFVNTRDLDVALRRRGVDDDTRAAALAAWESVFGHRSFTGRSQTMHGYEGLGSIYWHMVVKLQLAIQERVFDAVEAGADDGTVAALIERYELVRRGMGHRRTVAQYGTFPLDPHSHSPSQTGARQPGMTGTTKESILVRLGELGVVVSDGRVSFRPVLLTSDDLHDVAVTWEPFGEAIELGPRTLGFTYCAVPVVYQATDDELCARVTWADGRTTESDPRLDAAASAALFSRRGEITRIDVGVRIPGGRNH